MPDPRNSRDKHNIELQIKQMLAEKADKEELAKTGKIRKPRSLYHQKLAEDLKKKQTFVSQDNIPYKQREEKDNQLKKSLPAGYKPLVYLANPDKILGDLGVSDMPTTEEDNKQLVLNQDKTGLEMGMKYVPEATVNLALGAAFAPEGAGIKRILNESLNPLAGINKLGNKYIPNTHKLNPLAFKPNPEAYYRIVGKDAEEDALQSGLVRSKPSVNSLQENTINLSNRPTAFPSFSKGKISSEYANGLSTHSLIETERAMAPSNMGRHGKGTTQFPIDTNGKYLNQFPLEEAKIYQKDWLQGYKQITPQYAYGGNLNNSTMQNNQLTEFNEGGTHSQNPHGGIPMNGNNTVEQGETKIGNYVYSNRLSIDENMAKDMNLPTYIKGKTFADASKAINNKFKDRNDKPSLETKKILLNRLINAQELIKAQKLAEINKSMKANSQEIPDQMNGEIPAGMEEYTNQNQMFLGGKLEGMAENGENPYMGIAQQGIGTINSLIAGDSEGAQAGAIKTGTTLAGTLIGGPIGGAVGGFIGDTVNNIIGGNSARKERNRLRKRQAFKASNEFTNDFATGGYLDEEDPTNPLFKPTNTIPQVGAIPSPNIVGYPRVPVSAIDTTGLQRGITPSNILPTASTDIPTANTSKLPATTATGTSALGKVGDFLDKNGGKILKYAPVAMNAYQLSQLKRPKYERLDRLSNTYNPTYVDEKALQNIVSNENDNTINALTNASNGSVGALRSNILGANLNYTKAMSDAYLKANEANNAQKQYKQQFDLGVNQANMAQSNAELDINDRNRANYDTQKSRLLGSIGTDLGAIGKEEVNKNQIAEALGYTWSGEYVVNKKTGQKILAKNFFSQVNNNSFGDPDKFKNTSISYNPNTTFNIGGYLKTNKKGY